MEDEVSKFLILFLGFGGRLVVILGDGGLGLGLIWGFSFLVLGFGLWGVVAAWCWGDGGSWVMLLVVVGVELSGLMVLGVWCSRFFLGSVLVALQWRCSAW